MADGVQFVDGLVSQACLNAARPTSGSWLLVRGSLASVLLTLAGIPGARLVEVGELTTDGIAHPFYLARAGHEGNLHSGVCSFHFPGARIYVEGRELVASRYDVMVAVGEQPRWHPVGSISDLRQLKPVTSGFVSGSFRNEVTPSFVSRLTLPLRASVYGTLTSEGTTFRGFEEPWLMDTEDVQHRLEVLVIPEAGEGLADSARADDKVKVAIGKFKTDHDWTQVKKGDRYSTAVTFQQPFENVPPIILGFNKLDMGKHESALRLRLFPQNVVKDSFICNAEAWGETYLYNVFVNWMAIAEPRWQTGVLKTIANNPSALLDNRVDFEIPFSSPPMVFVCFNGLDMVGQWDFRAQATNVDHTGFSISLFSRPETTVGVARVSWIAIPGEDVLTRKNAWIGRFSTTAESAVHNGSGEWTGSVKFGFQFKAKPKIFIGVDQLAFSHDRNLRLYTGIRNVSKTGMDWRIKQWGNSALKGAGVSYLALDCE